MPDSAATVSHLLPAGSNIELEQLREYIRTPAGKGFLMLAIMAAAFGMAMSSQENIVTNYFEDVLGLEGPQFGYITAIREVPGFLLIFLTALFYKMTIPRLTAMALVLLAVGYMLFGVSNSFWTVAPWVILSSMGYHTVLQTQYALGMSLTTENKSGSILGKMTAVHNGGALVAMIFVLVVFYFDLISFRPMFVISGLLALVAAIAIFNFPNLQDGKEHVTPPPQRDRFVLNRSYKYYYLLNLLDGGRQQIFFSFGLWVLVNNYGLVVWQISALLIGVRLAAMVSGPWIGRMIDVHGERQMLGLINFAYIFALGGYALVDNVLFAAGCYIVYSFIFPLSSVGAATYLRKVAIQKEIAPSLAMGVTLNHAAAIIVPITTGFILNFVGFQIPFLIACGFATLTIFVTRRLDPATQKSPARIAEDEARAALARQEALIPAVINDGK
jgi:predicted MFS family arabinose efflux permease